MQSKKWTSVGLAGAFLTLASTAWADVLSNNLSEITTDLEYLSGPVQVAAGFKTDNQSYTLDNVILQLANPFSGQAVASLYTDNGSQPGSLVGALISPLLYLPDPTPMTFSGNNLFLDINTSYFIMLQAISAQFAWAWTESNSGTDPGFKTNWAVSTSPGVWSSFASEPLQMQVNATATPEPGSLVLLGAGLLGLGFFAKRRRDVKPLVLAVAAVTLPASAAIAAPKADRTLLTVTSPKTGGSLRGPYAKIDIAISSAANRGSFSAKLNGKNITNLFSRSGHCRGGNCAESALLLPAFGLVEGTNVVRLRIERFDGNYDYHRLRFVWTASPTALGDAPAEMPSVYSFTTLTPGGYSNQSAWFQISSNGLRGTATPFPANPPTCTTRYILVIIDRRTLAEVSTTCVDPDQLVSILPIVPGTQFAVIGTIAGNNADYTTLNLLPIGGTDFRTNDADDAPLGLMAIGIGQTSYGVAHQSYRTNRDAAFDIHAQLNGLLTQNDFGTFDYHPSDNVVFSVDGPKKQIVLDGATYTPPGLPTTGFWVLPMNRTLLQNADCTSSDSGLTYLNCGRAFDATDPLQLQLLSDYLQPLTWRDLVFIVGFGQQSSLIIPSNIINAMASLGIPYVSYAEMTSPDSVFAMAGSPDPEVSKSMIAGDTPFSSSANASIGQNGQLIGALSRSMYELYKPTYSAQQISDALLENYKPIDPSLIKIAYSPAQPWPMMDTPGHIAAYQNLSNQIVTYLWPVQNTQPEITDDLRYLYTNPNDNSLFKNIDLKTIGTTFPYPGDGNGFSAQEYSDVLGQLTVELADVVAVIDYLGDGGGVDLKSRLIEGNESAVLSLFSSVGDCLSDLNAPNNTQVNADMSNILNMAGAIVSIFATIVAPEAAPVLAVASGVLWAAGSAGVVDTNNSGIPTPDYAILVTADELANNYRQYLSHADAAYDTLMDNILSDWYRLNTVAYATAHQWSLNNYVLPDSFTQTITDGAGRYFYSTLAGSVYSIDGFYSEPNAANNQPPTPNLLGAWTSICPANTANCIPDKCTSLYPGYTGPSDGWAIFPSVPIASPMRSDVYIIGGSISKNASQDMQEHLPSSDVLNKLFEVYGLPKDLFYTLGPLPWRSGPTYSDFGYCRTDQH